MTITVKKQTTQTVNVELQVPSFRKCRTYGEVVNVAALISRGGKEIAIDAYSSTSLTQIMNQPAAGISEYWLRDFNEGEEITEETFWEVYNSIKAQL